jgi:murein DD-endopeptidase MepM/ murein hydrolase activator NlpD
MTVFKGKDWIRKTKVQLQDLTAKVKLTRINKEISSRIIQKIKDNKIAIAKGTAAFALLIGISATGNQYIINNTYNVYHVIVEGKEIGVVSDPLVIEKAKEDKHKQVQSENPDVHMVLDNKKIEFQKEKAFMAQYDDLTAVQKLKPLLTAHVTGVELVINNEVVAILKDEEEANLVLEEFKDKYSGVKKKPSNVTILSASDEGAPDVNETRELKSVEFEQEVDIEPVANIDAEDIADTDTVLAILQAMGEMPQKYIVQEGDCVSCIAAKFGIKDLQYFYDLNSWIVDDMIRIGDEVIVKGFEPTLAVRTIEQYTDEEEIQFDTVYVQDPELRTGKSKTLIEGKNGLKRVTYETTSINGVLLNENLLNEVVLTEPVSAKVAKGTFRPKGEGTGKFAWPVSGAKLTSSFGKRWGTTHKGIDMASSNRTIKASDTGVVVFSGKNGSYGNCVIIDHKNGYQTLYGHMSKISVKKGDVIEKGEKVGVMGSTGHSTGVHLHFEIQVDGTAKNPIKYLSK